MKLKGKALEEFEAWFIPYVKENLHDYNKEEWNSDKELLKQFYSSITFSMQWGVYQDFFDSVELEIKDRILPRVTKGYDCYFTELKEVLIQCETRQEAREKAIEKAVEIFNERV